MYNIPNRTLPKCTISQVRCPNVIKMSDIFSVLAITDDWDTICRQYIFEKMSFGNLSDGKCKSCSYHHILNIVSGYDAVHYRTDSINN